QAIKESEVIDISNSFNTVERDIFYPFS
ncbi:MAG: hypothetical protein RL217_2148, partial [Pseudomonadota bacterium]